METNHLDHTPRDLADLKRLLRHKWPDAAGPTPERLRLTFSTGLDSLDRLFPNGGIPCGQLLEITGEPSSGKTSLLYTMLAALTRNGRAVYIDPARAFFPAAAAACGIDLNRLLTVTPATIPAGLRVAELLLQYNVTPWIVFDLVGQRQLIPMIMLHRLRIKATRARGLIFFLTEGSPTVIPPSMVALRLAVSRGDKSTVRVTVVRSRISREGVSTEVSLGG